MSLLADKKAAAAAQRAPSTEESSLLVRRRAQVPRGEYVEMPVLGRVWVELIGESAMAELEGATIAAMKADGLEPSAMNMQAYDQCRTALMLAWAVRHPENHAQRAGSQEEWRATDVDLVVACGYIYADVRERLSPVQMGALTQEKIDEIRLAIEKKNAMPLVRAGVVALSLYLLSTGDPPANSPTTKSSTGESQ